jgi:hypothetical protein
MGKNITPDKRSIIIASNVRIILSGTTCEIKETRMVSYLECGN